MNRPLAALAAAAFALTLAGCAQASPGATPGPGSSVSVPSPAVPVPAPTGSVTPAPSAGSAGTAALAHLAVHHGSPPAGSAVGPSWRVRSAKPSASSVQIGWYDSVSPACGAVDSAWVTETATTVTIDLVHAARRSGMLCAAILVPRRAVVPLAAPLGDRTLLEARTVSPVPRASCPPGTGPIRPAVLCPLKH